MSDKPYRQPFVEVGMSVLWHPDGNTAGGGHAAVVTRLGNDSVCVNVIEPNNYNFVIRDGVRHVSDPRTKQAERHEAGTWDYTPLTRRLLSMLRELEPGQETKKKG